MRLGTVSPPDGFALGSPGFESDNDSMALCWVYYRNLSYTEMYVFVAISSAQISVQGKVPEADACVGHGRLASPLLPKAPMGVETEG